MYPRRVRTFFTIAVIATTALGMVAQHDHPAPEKLGSVNFTVSCSAAAQTEFNRAVALLHSFTYSESEQSFRRVLTIDPACAMAHWGVAMSYYHQLWEPPLNSGGYEKGVAELSLVTRVQPQTAREKEFIAALNAVYSNADNEPLRERMLVYERQHERSRQGQSQ